VSGPPFVIRRFRSRATVLAEERKKGHCSGCVDEFYYFLVLRVVCSSTAGEHKTSAAQERSESEGLS